MCYFYFYEYNFNFKFRLDNIKFNIIVISFFILF